VGSGSVLFVGDERVESYSGLNRVVHPGTPAGDPALGELGQQGVVIPSTPTGPYPLPNPRPQGAVMATESGYELWTWSGLGGAHLTSTDGVTWPLENRQLTTLTTSAGPTYDQKAGPSSVVRNPRYGQPGQPKYYALRSLPGPVSKRPIPPSGDDPGQVERRAHNYYAFSSDNGVDWVFLDEEHPALIGHDVVNVSYDPVTHRFVASFKQWVHTKSDAGVSHYDRTARTVLVSTSEDFVKWTDPLPALASDMRDYDEVAAAYPGDGGAVETAYGKPVKSSDIYSMPVFRYGEQYLGVPTLFDITYAAREVFPDIGHAHLELASSQNLVNWSRPNRDKLVTPIEDGWNRGFHLADAMISVGDEVWLYYGSFKGKHSCPESAAEPEKGCQPVVDNFGGSQTGRVIWQKDRFVSFHAAPGGGNVTTRPLVPQAHGDSLQVNVATGDGELKIEVLDAKGVPIPGYTLADATPVKGDTLSQTVTWGARSTLPNGPIRLRFSLSAGDLYSYAIS
jgi:hypothetical protein